MTFSYYLFDCKPLKVNTKAEAFPERACYLNSFKMVMVHVFSKVPKGII